MDQETVDQFRQALPDKVKKSVNPQIIQQIYNTLSEPEMYDSYRDNLLSYASVMKDGRFKLSSYIDAVKYVSHKLRGLTNTDAFATTFPLKIQDWSKRGIASKDQASYITAYNKSKLVGLIMEQSLIPSWVLNQDLYQRAINTQAELMISANSEKVRTDAANSLLTHLKPPETQKIELSVEATENTALNELRETTAQLAKQQREMIQSGSMSVKQVAHSQVIEGEKVIE